MAASDEKSTATIIYGVNPPARMICIKLPLFLLRPLLLAATALAFSAGSAAQTGPQPKLRTIDLQAGLHIIKTELAVTPEQQQTGMMFRKEMGTNEGMLFVDETSSLRCFWMRNTYVPLSIAFIADDGTIVNIADMEPLSEKSHCSAQPVRFALEVNRGWFAKRGIKAGTKIKGAPFKR
jgi:uncharacterized protein